MGGVPLLTRERFPSLSSNELPQIQPDEANYNETDGFLVSSHHKKLRSPDHKNWGVI